MQIHDRIPLGKEAGILGSRYVTQTDDDLVSYRMMTTCGATLLFEVRDGEVYLVASEGTEEEIENYAQQLAEKWDGG
ncbi:MAG: hypothetical protein K1Y36_04150 [Blastocatellia bacterium]|nr:hypothetical protein [Blastocatellia bacterium]